VVRKVATAAALWAKQRRIPRVGFVMRELPRDAAAEMAQAIAEGLTLGEFDGGSYKTGAYQAPAAPAWTVVAAGGEEVASFGRAAVARGWLLGDCSNLSRQLANEPGNTLTPREFARRAAVIAGEAGVAVDVLDEERIAQLGMGLLLGVARGSTEPARLLVFRYDPPSAPATPVLGLVGKGVTFDSGGISIAADGMERMKTTWRRRRGRVRDARHRAAEGANPRDRHRRPPKTCPAGRPCRAMC
jgi:leucyl aminopeptidase